MIRILEIDKKPLTKIGQVAGYCYDTTNPKAFKRIGKSCLAEGHGRTLEFVDMILEIDGISAKLARELYTHIIGTSRLQASTRYIDYSKQFDYVTPETIQKNEEALKVWNLHMTQVQGAMRKLKELGIPTEDFTNVLPLAYSTKVVIKINLRSLIHMFNVRACSCAYLEFRQLMANIKHLLSDVDEEWKEIADKYFVPKCVAVGYCEEKRRHCGLRPLKGE